MKQDQNEGVSLGYGTIIIENVNEIEAQKSPNFIRVYANMVRISTTPWDMSFMFAQPIIDNPNAIYIEQRAYVNMTLKAAKEFLQLLDRTIKQHEQEHGDI